MIVAVEGLDGSGKRTLALRLQKYLESQSLQVKVLSFPRYQDGPIGEAIQAGLKGEPAIRHVLADPRASSVLFALDRFGSVDPPTSGSVLIVDRYISSNIAYSTARLPAGDRDEFQNYLAQLEINILRTPVPSVQLLLKTARSVARESVTERASVSSDRETDMYEQSEKLQMAAEERYESLARASFLSPWLLVQRDADQETLWQRIRACVPVIG